LARPLIKNGTIPRTTASISLQAYRQKKCGTTKEEMERTVLEESWRRNRPVGPSLEVIDDDVNTFQYRYLPLFSQNILPFLINLT
jgi:hypothetical protein